MEDKNKLNQDLEQNNASGDPFGLSGGLSKSSGVSEKMSKKPVNSLLEKANVNVLMKRVADFWLNLKKKLVPKKKKTEVITKTEKPVELSNTAEKQKIETPSKTLLSSLFQKEEQVSPKEKKNLFVEIFPQEKQEATENQGESLIDTIMEQSAQKKKEEKTRPETTSILGQKLQDKFSDQDGIKKEVTPAENDLIFWSKVSLGIGALIPLIVYVFFHFQLATDSKILNFLGIDKNIGIEHQEKKAELERLKQRLIEIPQEEQVLKHSLLNHPVEMAIKQVKNESVDWVDMVSKINKVTNKAISFNNVLERLVYKTYSFAVQGNQINLSAELFDPNNLVFSLMKDYINEVNDSGYFTGLEMRNFAKTVDDEGAKMSLSLNFTYIPVTDSGAQLDVGTGSVLN